MKTGPKAIALFCLACLTLACQGRAQGADCARPVETGGGPVIGKAAQAPGVCAWLGVPYAAPPVGELRWRRPAPALAWSSPLQADEFGQQCVQLGLFDSSEKKGRPKGSEDCLYLNVWSPSREGKRPVMVWIHGGGLMSGSGDSAIYTGDRLARSQEVVVVTFNYRLGVFGFFAHPAFRAEDPDGSVGGYGMMDQIAALEWVRDNIAAFGGDPQNVTIFGESAGGWSVCQLLASPAARGLFHRAIQESGGCNRTVTLEQGLNYGLELGAELDCADEDAATCLRAKSPRAIMKAAPWSSAGDGMPFRVCEDGHLLKKLPLDHLRDGDYNHVPFIAGSNRDEYKLFALLEPGLAKLSREEYETRVRAQTGDWADRFLALYPVETFESPYLAYLTFWADRNPGCGALDAVDAVARRQSEVYFYRFDFDDYPAAKKLGAFHGLEIVFVFGAFERGPLAKLLGPRVLELARPLSALIQGYWAGFARAGTPNAAGVPEWPAYDPTARRRLVLDVGEPTVMEEPEENYERCRRWDEYVRQVERKRPTPLP